MSIGRSRCWRVWGGLIAGGMLVVGSGVSRAQEAASAPSSTSGSGSTGAGSGQGSGSPSQPGGSTAPGSDPSVAGCVRPPVVCPPYLIGNGWRWGWGWPTVTGIPSPVYQGFGPGVFWYPPLEFPWNPPVMLAPPQPMLSQPTIVLNEVRDERPEMQVRPERPVRTVSRGRIEELVAMGDRMFRGGNTGRAEDRYKQAMNAAPTSALPRIRMAQLAIAKGEWTEAAHRIREAVAAEPGWLLTAPDIRAMYGEPGDFWKVVESIESHLQTNPEDRDGWLVLGTQLYLAGRTQQAADVFLRLTDRKPDPTLASLLEASRVR